MLDAPARRALDKDEPDHEGADRVRDAELERNARDEDGKTHETHGEELVVVGVHETTDEARALPGDDCQEEQEAERFCDRADRFERAVGLGKDRLQQRQIAREKQVLDDDDPENYSTLGVGDAMKLYEQLGCDRR